MRRLLHRLITALLRGIGQILGGLSIVDFTIFSLERLNLNCLRRRNGSGSVNGRPTSKVAH